MMDIFILRFLLSTILVSLLILIILFTKKIFAKHMSKQTHYKVWYFLFTPLLISFFPWDFFRLHEISQYMKSLMFTNRNTPLNHEQISGVEVSQAPNTNVLHDFSVSVNKATPDFFYHTFMAVWITGMVIFVVMAIYANYQIRQLKKSAAPIQNEKVNELLEVCKEMVGVKRKIKLQETALIASPSTLGLIQPYILLPKTTLETFSLNDLKYVFLHELTHQKNKDVLINYVMLLLNIMYWFNPFVWHALKVMRMDRELACDAAVLNRLDESGYIEYGQTIIHFADKQQSRAFGQYASGMGGTKTQIKQRIKSIANYAGDSQLLKWKSKAICAALGIFMLCLTPLTWVIASSDDVYQFNKKNVIYEDLSSYFHGYNGSFVLYDPFKNQYQIYNRKMSEQRVSPNSTYKIYSALFALETNVITPHHNEQFWDGTVYPYKEWNTNQSLSTALGSSVNWYFQHLDQKVGKKQLQSYFHHINYGNEDLSGNLERYWIESSLKISPIEQVQILYGLDENTFGFKEENVRAVKNAILIDEQKHRQLFGKTGTGSINGNNVNGWFIGFVKKNDRSFYFAVNIQNKKGHANGSKAADIARQILRDKRIYE